MLRLLQKKEHKFLYLMLCLAGASLGLHILVLVPLFVSDVGGDMVYKMTIGLEPIDLAYVSISYTTEPKKALPVRSESTQKKGCSHVATKKASLAQKNSTSIQQKKSVPKKQVPRPIQKKAVSLKQMAKAPAKSIVKPSQKKVPVKKVVSTPKKEFAVVEKKQNKPIQQIKAEEKKVNDFGEQNIMSAHRFVTPQEYSLLELKAFVQEAIQEQWHPPAGLSKDLVCDVLLSIDTTGKATQCTLTSGSGVLMYDVHVQSTLLAVHYPRAVWGKKMEISFACA